MQPIVPELDYSFDSDEGDYSLIQGDCLNVLQRVADHSVDMIFADPPYFLSNGGVTCKSGKMASVDKGNWDKSGGIGEDYGFHLAWLRECRRVLKPSGSIWVSGTHHTIFAIGFAMQNLGYKVLNDIVWYKKNPPPNLSCRYFTHSTETILWARVSETCRHKFNYKVMKEMNHGKQMQSLWTIMAPRASEKLLGRHPTQKPMELLERILLASTEPGDLILDPFCGSGTTGVAAAKLGRRFLGIELSPEYAALSVRRYQAQKQGDTAPELPAQPTTQDYVHAPSLN